MGEKKRIALITGASSGLGAEFVRQMDEEEDLDEMWVIARRRERLEKLGVSVHTPLRILPLDLARRESMDRLSEELEREQPVVSILINAAGLGKIGSWEDIRRRDCDNMVDINCRAAVDVTQIAIPYMVRGSRILEICSTAAFQPLPYLNVYAATKAFLYSYTRALRVELKKTGISVTAVCPYWIRDTEFIATAQKTKGSGSIRHFPFASRASDVAASALRAGRRNAAVCTPGLFSTGQRIIAKILPRSLMMRLWSLIR